MEGDRMQQFESFAQMQRDAAMRVMEMQRRAQAAMRNAAPPPALPALTQPDDASPLMEPETAQTGPHQPVCEAHEPMNPPQGIISGFLTYKVRSIWPAVLFHASINGMDRWAPSTLFMSKKPNMFLGPDLLGFIGGLGFIIIDVVLIMNMRKWKKGEI